MVSQRQYDELVVKAAEALPVIAQALADANVIRCVSTLYDHGDIDQDQMDQFIYTILARKVELNKTATENEKTEGRPRYSEEYWRRRRSDRNV